MKYIKKFNESKDLDIWGDMRSKGFTSDQCSEISDYIQICFKTFFYLK